MNIVLVSATPFEIAPINQYLLEHFQQKGLYTFQKGALTVHLIVTGVGQVATTFHLTDFFHEHKDIDLAINAGIAGTFNRDWKIGDVVHITKERFGDLGVEEKDSAFTDIFELELIGADQFPFKDGWMVNEDTESFKFLPVASGITVNKVHGAEKSIEAIAAKYQADMETMEGAAFFYVCLQRQVSFLAIRGISNYVEPRNRDSWDIPLAINNLNEVLVKIIGPLEGG